MNHGTHDDYRQAFNAISMMLGLWSAVCWLIC